MPRPLTPTSSQEIIPISPPVTTKRHTKAGGSTYEPEITKKTSIPFGKEIITTSKTISNMSNYASTSCSKQLNKGEPTTTSTTLPTPITFQPTTELRGKIQEHVRKDKFLQQIGHVPTPGDPLYTPYSTSTSITRSGGATDVDVKKGVKRLREEEVEKERCRLGEGKGTNRERTTQRMMSTLGKGSNPITNSDLYTRTDHFVSSATGHQQSNSGGGSAGQATYWEVRKAKMAEQAREQQTTILAGCVFFLNGSTGPKVSNLQLQNIITSNGGRFIPIQGGSCTHIIANGGLSGTKTQKWINGQGARGLAKRMKVVTTDWILDSVGNGKRVSEAGYGVIQDPSNLFTAFGAKPKVERNREGVVGKEDSVDLS